MSATGPTTPSGKAIASRNAIRHGVLATIPVVPGLERQEDWDSHRDGVLESLAPEGHLEHVLAERVALQLWRLHRIARYEGLAVVAAHGRLELDRAKREKSDPLFDPSLADLLTAAEALSRERRELLRHLQELPHLEEDAPFTGDQAELIAWAMEAVIEPLDRSGISLPFLDADQAIEDYPAWTANKLRQLLKAFEEAAAREPGRILAEAAQRVAADIAASATKRPVVYARIKDMRAAWTARFNEEQRDRLVPSADEMERIARYEAHLSRELYKAMHELEALQARRHGRSTPLARLDVDVAGLPENPKLRNELPT